MGSLDPYSNPNSKSGSGSRRAKMSNKHRKNVGQFDKKNIKKISAVFFFLQFLVIRNLYPDSLVMLDPNPDPQLCEK
jgi:hypothetical protein